MPELNIQGGSQGEPSFNFVSPFFHKDVRATELRPKFTYKLRLLPGFDRDRFQPTDEGFSTSFIPYRDANLKPDPDTKTPGFTSWYYSFQGYTWLGRQQKGFFSPLTISRAPGKDPIYDCYQYCKRINSPELQRLIKKPEGKNEKSIIPLPRTWAFMNALLEVDGDMQNHIVYVSSMSFADLKDRLSIRAGRGDAVVSPEWEDYLYGDVTHPMQGLIATVKKGLPQNNQQGIETPCFYFSKKDKFLDGAERMELDPSSPEGIAALSGRYNMMDSDNVTRVPTYDEMLQYIVDDGTIPYEVIHEACKTFVQHVPACPTRTAAADEQPDDGDNIPMGNPVQGLAASANSRTSFTGGQTSVAPTTPAARPAFGSTPKPAAAPLAPAKPLPTTKPVVPPAAAAPTPPAAKVTPALQPTAPTEPAGDLEAQTARYNELVQKFSENAATVTPAEMQEMVQLSQIVVAR